MRLGIDLDGVVADFNLGWMTRYNREQGTQLTVEMVTGWDVIPQLTHFADMREFWEWARDHDGASLFRRLDPFPDAIDTLWRLAKSRHQVVVITSKPWWAIHDTYAWLGEHRVPTWEVHISYRKWEVECDVYLDDSPQVLLDLVSHRPDRTVCRFIRPWNRPIPGTFDIESWKSFEEFIETTATRSGDNA